MGNKKLLCVNTCFIKFDVLFRETRYLLFLTENYSALRILQQANLLDHDPLILFGSSFPEDLNYTQVTTCMDTS